MASQSRAIRSVQLVHAEGGAHATVLARRHEVTPVTFG